MTARPSLWQNLIYKEIILTSVNTKRTDKIQPKTFGAYRPQEGQWLQWKATLGNTRQVGRAVQYADMLYFTLPKSTLKLTLLLRPSYRWGNLSEVLCSKSLSLSVKAIVWSRAIWLHTIVNLHLTLAIVSRGNLRPTEIKSYNRLGTILTVILWCGLFIFHIFKYLANRKSHLGKVYLFIK